MQISNLKLQRLIVLECLSGSKAYGLDTPASDTDIKGVFVLPKAQFYGLKYTPQVNDEKNDVVYYELGRFIELLSVNNPNILELLSTSGSAIMHKNSILDQLKPDLFLSKLCKNSFGKFALSQIKKARGLKKKIVNPMNKERKSPLDFCYINHQKGSVSATHFLSKKGWAQEDCGLVNIPNMKNIYGLYYSKNLNYKGIIKDIKANDISLSPIPKDQKEEALLCFNKDGYSVYCKEYREYWEWVEKRNEARFENSQRHGKNYDTKNMMHTFRLLDMAIEIGKYGQVNVHRPNRDFLLSIKSGEFEYEELLKMAADRQAEMEQAFEKSNLPDRPDLAAIDALLVSLREEFYG